MSQRGSIPEMRAGLLAAALLLGACGPGGRPITALETPFDPESFAAFDVAGEARILGAARLARPDGSTATCAGSAVRLMPDTPVTRETIDKIRNGFRVRPLVSGPDAFPRAFRRTACDPDGRFAFEAVAAGSWIVFTEVVWKDPDGTIEGRTLGRFVTVPAAGTVEPVLGEADDWEG